MKSLVETISEFISTRTNTNPEFADICAAVCVATAVGNRVFVADRIGDVYLNLFGLNIGGSGVSNKTQAINKVREIIRQLSKELFSIQMRQLEDASIRRRRTEGVKGKKRKQQPQDDGDPNLVHTRDKDIYSLLVPTKFTTEGLTDWFMQKAMVMDEAHEGGVVGCAEGAMVADEYTEMFMSAQKKDYLASTLEYLSTLYDGYIPKSVTISRSVQEIEKVCVSFISATTPYLLTLMNMDSFRQGHGNRFLWVFDDNQKEIYPSTLELTEFFSNSERQKKDEKELYEIVNALANLRRMVDTAPLRETGGVKHRITVHNGMIIPSQDAMIRLASYHHDKRNLSVRLYNEDIMNTDANYISRLAQNAIKLAAIRCISRYWEYETWMEARVIMNVEDVEWGIAMVERSYQSYLKIRDIILLVSADGQSPSKLSDHQKILSAIERSGGKATKSQLLQITRWKSKDLIDLLSDMTTAKIIECVVVRSSGRPAEVYRKIV